MGASRHPARLTPHNVHVLQGGADILRGDVATAERLDEAPISTQERLALVTSGVSDDYGLTPTEVEPGRRGLVGHSFGEPKDILEALILGLVGVEPSPPQGRPQGGRVAVSYTHLTLPPIYSV